MSKYSLRLFLAILISVGLCAKPMIIWAATEKTESAKQTVTEAASSLVSGENKNLVPAEANASATNKITEPSKDIKKIDKKTNASESVTIPHSENSVTNTSDSKTIQKAADKTHPPNNVSVTETLVQVKKDSASIPLEYSAKKIDSSNTSPAATEQKPAQLPEEISALKFEPLQTFDVNSFFLIAELQKIPNRKEEEKTALEKPKEASAVKAEPSKNNEATAEKSIKVASDEKSIEKKEPPKKIKPGERFNKIVRYIPEGRYAGRFISVDGDNQKFRAHQWTKEGYGQNVNDFTIKYGKPEKTSASVTGRASILDEKYRGNASVRKNNLGYVSADYQQFPKYYDNVGGVYYPFSRYSGMTLDRDLKLNVGRLYVEAGLEKKHWPNLTAAYGLDFKDGEKSRLAWGAVRENSIRRNISPSWQEINEISQSFSLKDKFKLLGFDMKAEQRVELFDSNLKLHEQDFSTSNQADEKKIIEQIQNPTTISLISKIEADKWFWKDKGHTSTSYKFKTTRGEEDESINIFDSTLRPRSFSQYPNYWNATSSSDSNSHTLTTHLTFFPKPWLDVDTKISGELSDNSNDATYPIEASDPPNQIIDRTTLISSDRNTKRLGESIGVTFKKIPNTSIYGEFGFEQGLINLSEKSNSTPGQTASDIRDIFFRDTDMATIATVWTAGANCSPVKFLNLNSQFKFRQEINDFTNTKTTPIAGTAYSAFFDSMNVNTISLSNRATIPIFSWLQPSLRHEMLNSDYFTAAQGFSDVESNYFVNIYTVDLMLRPLKNLYVMGFYSKQNSIGKTPTITLFQNSFASDIDTWSANCTYSPLPYLAIKPEFTYSIAKNYNDFVSTGLPLGSAFERLGWKLGIKWSPNKTISIEPRYVFYRYLPNAHAEAGDYTVNAIECAVNIAWA